MPPSERGRRMRERLLVAARVVFERDGFLHARVTDIAAEAGASHGSFYSHFDSKTHVFRALMAETMDELYASLSDAEDGPDSTDAFLRVDRANRRFVEMYRQNTALMGLFEQAATFDPEIRALRTATRQRMAERVARSIERLQQEGKVAPVLDPHCSAHALVAMVNGLVHYWLVLGGEFEQEQLVRTLSQLWARALGLEVGDGKGGSPVSAAAGKARR